ncbi:MAG: magnesium transporter [Acholeplasmataceae bacterium]|nr:MAG: magnesium transporter [Acholeplasmataceae bacterium]
MAVLKDIRNLIKNNQLDLLKKALHDMESYLIADMIEVLEPEGQVIVFRLLDKDEALTVFEYVEVDVQQELIQNFTDERAIEFFKQLEPDDKAALLDELPAKVASRLLLSLSKKEKELTTLVMGYQAGTAGHVMTPKFIAFKQGTTVKEAFSKIRKVADEVETIYHLYVIDAQRRLKGMINLKDLITAELDENIETIMTDAISVNAGVEDEAVSKLLQDSDLLAIPVLDNEARLIGVVTVDDAMDILEEDALNRELDKAGLSDISNQESDRSKVLIQGKLWQVWRVRIPFLLITLVGGLLAGGMIDLFESTLEQIIVLAFFIPVVMDMGGNVGTQSSTIFTRALALGQIDFKRFMRQWTREMLIGLTMGLILGAAGASVAYVWQQSFTLAIVIFIALAATITIATMLGFMIPYILTKLGIDQVTAAAPLITTVKDITGLFIYFALATLMLL